MFEIIQSIESLTSTGHHLLCGDGVERSVFPHILILLADYKEQYVYIFSSVKLLFTTLQKMYDGSYSRR